MRRILFSGDGSSGDLLPMVLMAREFKLAGYDVCVCGSSEFSQMAQDFDVPFEAYPHNYSKLYLDNQRTGYIHNIRETIRHQEMLYQGEYELLSKIAPQFDVLVNFLAEIFTPAVAEAFKLPNIKLFTFPMVRSDRYGVPMGLPFVTENKWVNRLEWDAVTWGATRLFSYGKTVNRLRGQLGLPPVKDLAGHNSRCDHLMIGLYEELMPPCEAWGGLDYTYIGPCLPRTRVALSDDLEAFISGGEKPIYVGFGSMRHANSEQLTRTIVDAIERAGVRAILAQSTSQVGSDLEESDNLFVLRDYPIPHHILFPRLRGAVHHGSWITTHLAAQAGVPQLVLPQANDQFQWGSQVAKAGLGPDWVDMNRLTVKKLTAGIEQLVGNARYEANAQAFARRVEGIDGARNALRLFEELEGRLSPRTQISMAAG